MKSLPDDSVNLVVTSPPYWGLRDYGVGGQIGLEPDFRVYVRKLVEIFHEVKRVLKSDGSFYLNLGDTYSAGGGAGGQYRKWCSKNRIDGFKKFDGHKDRKISAKCLLGIPWRVTLSLIDDGWLLRNAIIWHKPNAIPSSVKDRLTNTYEHVFHFVKNRKYYYNLDAIRVPHKYVTVERVKKYIENKEHHDPSKHKTDPRGMNQPPSKVLENSAKKGLNPLGKNPGDVLTTVQDFTRPKTNLVMKTGGMLPPPNLHKENPERMWNPKGKNPGDSLSIDGVSFTRKVGKITKHEIEKARNQPSKRILRWIYKPNPLGCNPGDFLVISTRGFKGAHFAVYPEELLRRPILSSSRISDVVFDPFIGSGTTSVVAKKLGRHFLGCDINPDYVKMARRRVKDVIV